MITITIFQISGTNSYRLEPFDKVFDRKKYYVEIGFVTNLLLKMAKRLSRQPLLFELFVRIRENRPTNDYSCTISDRNSNSKYHLIIGYEMVALPPSPYSKFR